MGKKYEVLTHNSAVLHITVKDYANIDFLIKLKHTEVLKNYKQIYIYFSSLSKYTKCAVHIVHVNPQHLSGSVH